MTVTELIKEVHENAVNHGWWVKPKSYIELMALLHSEISEALEEIRNNHDPKEIYYEGHVTLEDGSVLKMTRKKPEQIIYDGCNTIHVTKPCGFSTELADIVIRLYDMAGWYRWVITEDTIASFYKRKIKKDDDYSQQLKSDLLVLALLQIHHDLSEGWYHLDDVMAASRAIARVYEISDLCGIDIDAVVLEKHAYNITRPYKHGGKAL